MPKTMGLPLMGHAYETGVNESMIDSMEEYITRDRHPGKLTFLMDS